jgi:hypothetical protein
VGRETDRPFGQSNSFQGSFDGPFLSVAAVNLDGEYDANMLSSSIDRNRQWQQEEI